MKCSFIELYDEGLIVMDESVKLQFFEDNQRQGPTVTVIQGMEELHTKDAAERIKLLLTGSHKRQFATTKCNDLDSIGHIFRAALGR